MQITEQPSPNFGPRRLGAPDMVVLHYTGMVTAHAAIDRLCDPGAEVSAHYVIAEDGRITRLVAETARAWHAGVAMWGGIPDINSRSIGIELANPGPLSDLPPFPARQMVALVALLRDVTARWPIPPQGIVGHSCVAPGRKIDPGPKFDWRGLGLAGLGVWLDPAPGDGGPVDAARFQRAARGFGYGAPETGTWDPATLAVWQAFQSRFRPGDDAAPHGPGIAQLERLAATWPAA